MTPTYDPKLVAFLQRCAEAFEEWPRLREAAHHLRELAQVAPDPFRVAIVGRMKAGKSTLINSLIGQPLAITDAEEATATINVISHGTEEQSTQFVAVWRDGRAEPFPLERLMPDWSGKTEAVIERTKRVRHLQLFSPAEKLREFEIIDTPGTGSAVEAHEKVTQEFLRPEAIEDSLAQGRKADAILYVISSAGRETDSDALALFGAGRLTAADPYNSLCVFHKWDGPTTATENPYLLACQRAAKLQEQLKNKVLTVLPVSGPLGLAAQHAPDAFFAGLLEVLRTQDGATLARIRKDKRWDEDPQRESARAAYPVMPWFCYLYLVEALLQERPETVAEARQVCLARSHLPELEALLQRHFFAHALTIKQCQLLQKASEAVEPGLRFLSQLAAEETADIERARRAAKVLSDLELAQWAQRKAEDAQGAAERILRLAVTISQEWQQYSERLKGLQRDLGVLRALHAEECLFAEADHAAIRAVCGSADGQFPTAHEMMELLARYRRSAHLAFEAEQKERYEHVVRRVEQAYQTLKKTTAP